MQSIGWYVMRLQAMSLGEVAWRVKSLLRDQLDRVRVPLNLLPHAGGAVAGPIAELPGFRVSDIRLAAWAGDNTPTDVAEWRDALVSSADRIVTGHLTFFDLKDKFLGEPINWNYDHGAGKETPRLPIQGVDYRDFKQSGDCKLVWEPNRHHHLVVLARAYRATGERRYAEAVVQQLESWMDQNPFGYGMNWRSPLELGVRLINWVWAVDLIRDSGALSEDFYARFRQNAFLHCWETARKFSKGSSANNHLVGEAAGVYVGASYFQRFEQSDAWRRESKAILCREIMAQTYEDGCIQEHGLGYQFFVLQFYIISGLVGRWIGDEFPAEYWARIEKMVDFVAALSEGGEDLPMFGDRDDGYVLDLGNRPESVEALLSVAAMLFDRADFKSQAKSFSETAFWLFGSASAERFENMPSGVSEPVVLESLSFPESGYHLLQSGKVGEGAISLFFDCAELGYGAIAAHGHADALSIALRVDRRDVLVDPGTYDYFTYPEWRQYFRKTFSHNTLMVDGQDQSELQGAFLWGKRANSRLEAWQSDGDASVITGSHDGYTRLPDPVIHRRTVRLKGEEGLLEIIDDVACTQVHDLSINFQFSEYCVVKPSDENTYRVEVEGIKQVLVFSFPDSLQSEVLLGSEDPKGGWISRGYHQKTPAPQIILKGKAEGASQFITRITISN
ncbi:MAG: heparinase II/III family protein [Candidatus Thiodiazotropha sp. (ex Myrtea sp. 'scaly one' KF741663)]|nr:heparinase II/III family protein [Candidatus Thiodiazotropha sp. (ex Myrtea sp. 'scaly one' KF741663)]